MADRLRISLELELSDPIRGTLGDPAGNRHEFSGWLELNSLVEDIWSAARRGGLTLATAEVKGGERRASR